MELSVILPIVQAVVLFHDFRLLAIRLPDDRAAIGLRALCRMFNLSIGSQLNRFQRDPNLAGQLILARVNTPSGPQYMDFLIVQAIPLWLIGLHFTAPFRKSAM